MKIISTLHNYLADGIQLALGEVVEVDKVTATHLLKLPGVKKAFAELPMEETLAPPAPIVEKD